MGSTASAIEQVVIVVAILALIMATRLQARPMREGPRRWRVPAVLVVVGIYLITSAGRGNKPVSFGGADLGYLVLGALICLVLGALRGSTIRIWNQGGVMMQRYAPLTVALWIVVIAVRAGMDLAAPHFGVAKALAAASVLFMFGLTLLGEAAVTALRAQRHAEPGLA